MPLDRVKSTVAIRCRRDSKHLVPAGGDVEFLDRGRVDAVARDDRRVLIRG